MSSSFEFQESERKGNPLRTIREAIVNFLKRDDGPTAVEYAVMLALVVVVCITSIQALGNNAKVTFNKVGTAVGTSGS